MNTDNRFKLHAKILIVAFIALLGYTLYLYTKDEHFGLANDIYGPLYAFFYVYGAIYGLIYVKKIGLNSYLGNSIVAFSFAGLTYASALLIWGYLVLQAGSSDDLPYPSIADISYLMIYPCAFIGSYYLLKIYQINISRKSILFAVVGVIISGFLSYYFIGLEAFEASASWYVDLAFVLGDWVVVSIALAILLITGGKVSRGLLFIILFAVSQGIGDFIYTYQINTETFWDGSISDVFFALSGLFLSLGILDIVNKFRPKEVGESSAPSESSMPSGNTLGV